MGIERRFSLDALDQFLESIYNIFFSEVVRAFSYLGERCVRNVRDRSGDDSWYDRTGNLRSSIGYAVIEDGRKIIESAFQSVKGGTEGSVAGRKMIDELAKEYSKTYALVVVAGMEYAEYVEAMKGKDVLASTEIWAKSVVNDYLGKAIDRATDKIHKLQQQLGL